MKKSNGLMSKRNKIIPNERRRQTWRKHRLNLIDRRSKWFYQHDAAEENSSADDTGAVTTEAPSAGQER